MQRLWLMTGLILACLLALFLIAGALRVPLLADPRPWLGRGGVLAALLGMGLLVGDLLLPVPASLVMVAHGALFGVPVGALLSLAGSTSAAMLGFGIGRRGGALLGRLLPAAEQATGERLLGRWSTLAVAITRPIPLLGDAVALLAGASGLSGRQVALAAVAGSLPPALLYAAIGATAATFANGALALILLILASGLAWLGACWAESHLTRSAPR